MSRYRIVRVSRQTGRRTTLKPNLSLIEANQLLKQYENNEIFIYVISKQV